MSLLQQQLGQVRFCSVVTNDMAALAPATQLRPVSDVGWVINPCYTAVVVNLKFPADVVFHFHHSLCMEYTSLAAIRSLFHSRITIPDPLVVRPTARETLIAYRGESCSNTLC